MLHAMIMAGGGGTRFWPRSRSKRPKQFLTFSGDRTLLQGTVDRLAAQIPPERTWVITGEQYVAETRSQLPEVPASNIIGEPAARDTAPCVGLGAAIIGKVDPEATIAVMPADHVIEPVQEFRRELHAAEQFVHDFPEKLVTFGIHPTFPSTGYGYIKRGEPAGTRQGVNAAHVVEFKEKPEFPVAEQYLSAGNYDWNSGIFVWKPRTILGELHTRKPDIHAIVLRIAAAWGTPVWNDVFRASYATAEKKSIDYVVMQDAAKEGKVLVLTAPYTWDDVGSWLALERGNPQDANHNTVQALHCGIETKNCVIVGDSDRMIGTYGVNGLLIVQNGNAILVADRKYEDKVKEIVDKLKNTGRGVHVMGESEDPSPQPPPPRGEGEQDKAPLPSQGRGVGGLGSTGSLLGIDFGTKRIGLAVCDPDRVIASPLGTQANDSGKEAFFAELVTRSKFVGIVVGLPLHSNGDESDMSRQVREFAKWLADLSKLPVVMWDERCTSAAAEDALREAKMTRNKRKARVDRVAAQMILQSFLDAKCPVGGSDAIFAKPTSEDARGTTSN